MANQIRWKIDTSEFTAFMEDRKIRMRRAAMYNVREGGRVVARAAKEKAPVLKDNRYPTVTAMNRGMRFRAAGGIGPFPGQQALAMNPDTGQQSVYGGPVRGLLRASIKPSRQLRRIGLDTFALKVGPRGLRVHLYSQKQEDRYYYMEAGFHAVEAQMAIICQRSYARAWSR